MSKTSCLVAFMLFGICAVAQTVSVKSPDGRNEIRLDTEPVLSYSVYQAGLQRIAPTPLSLEVEGKGVLGGAVKVSSIDTVTLKGTIRTPIYKKALIDEVMVLIDEGASLRPLRSVRLGSLSDIIHPLKVVWSISSGAKLSGV